MLQEIKRALGVVCLGLVVLGGAYPFVLAAIGRFLFSYETNGSLVVSNGQAIGSEIIAQRFTGESYLMPRPSYAGSNGYDGADSSGSNLSPSSPQYKSLIEERADAYRNFNKVPMNIRLPLDAVTASGSGLDPEISLENAFLQAKRIAEARGVSEKQLRSIIRDKSVRSIFDRLGRRTVNVLECNMAIDQFVRNVKFMGEENAKDD